MKEAIELLCEKLGMVIDWGAENVWPQVLEVLEKYRTYEIVIDAVAIPIFTVIIVTYIIFITRVFTERKLIIQKFNEYLDLPCNSEERELFELHPNKYWDDNRTTDPDFTCATFGILLVGGVVAVLCFFILLCGVIPDLLKWIFIPEVQWIDVLQSLAK